MGAMVVSFPCHRDDSFFSVLARYCSVELAIPMFLRKCKPFYYLVLLCSFFECDIVLLCSLAPSACLNVFYMA